MTTIIEEPKIKESEKIIFSPIITHKNSYCPDLLKMEIDEEFTRIDFIYYARSYYINGGWIQISKDTFIRPCGSESKFKLLKAVNIPIAPVKHYFKSTKDILCYTLYFLALPKGITKIDIIESETHGGNWFNFFGVLMEKVRTEKLIVGN